MGDKIEVIPCEQRLAIFSRRCERKCKLGVAPGNLPIPGPLGSSEVSSRVCKLRTTQDHNVFLCVSLGPTDGLKVFEVARL
jgi:hypothetical protein